MPRAWPFLPCRGEPPLNLPRIPRIAMVRPAPRKGRQGHDVADIFDELNSDFRAERMRQTALRLAVPGVILLLLAAAAVAGWQVWRTNQAHKAEEVAAAYAAAARDAGGLATAAAAATPARAAAQAEFGRLAATAPAGYRSLARLRDAALRAAANDLTGAMQQWDALASDDAADPPVARRGTPARGPARCGCWRACGG